MLGRPEKWGSGESISGLNLCAGVQNPRGTGQTKTRLRHLREIQAKLYGKKQDTEQRAEGIGNKAEARVKDWLKGMGAREA